MKDTIALNRPASLPLTSYTGTYNHEVYGKMTIAIENKKLIAAFLFIIFSLLFWAIFEQSGGSLSLFALNNVEHDFLGIGMDPNIVNNSSNALFVIIFAPLLGLACLASSREHR